MTTLSRHQIDFDETLIVWNPEESRQIKVTYDGAGFAAEVEPRPDEPFYDEDIGPAFADLLSKCAVEHGAPIFAADLAEGGCTPENLRLYADRWEAVGFELQPASFATELRDLADKIERNA